MRLKDYFRSETQVGSSVTCDPPVLDTDIDFLILIKQENLETVHELLGQTGWTSHYDQYTGPKKDIKPFRAYRKGKINYILTWDDDYHRRFLEASSLAKRFNLLNKADRVDLFNLALYGTYVTSSASQEEEENEFGF